MESGKEEVDVLREMGLKSKPLYRKMNYGLLEELWKIEKKKTFLDFVRLFNKKNVVPILQAMNKITKFCHDQKGDMLQLGCTLPNLAIVCIHKSKDRKFYPPSKQKNTCMRKYDLKRLVVHQKCLGGKLL